MPWRHRSRDKQNPRTIVRDDCAGESVTTIGGTVGPDNHRFLSYASQTPDLPERYARQLWRTRKRAPPTEVDGAILTGELNRSFVTGSIGATTLGGTIVLELLAAVGLILAVFFLPFLLMQIPRLRAGLVSRVAENGSQPRAWLRRLTGIGAMAAGPLYGFAFPLAAIPAGLAVFTRPLAGWPRRTKALVLWALAGIVMLALSAVYQDQEISGNILHYAAFALFATAAVKMTSGPSSAAQLLGWSALGSALFYVIFRPTNTDTFEHLWKYGLGPYVAIAILWFLCSLGGRRTLPVIALLAIGCASLFLGFRSHGLVCFVVIVILLVKGKSKAGRIPFFKVILAGGALYGLSSILPKAIEAGVFGEAVRQRTVSQLGENGPALLAGRVEPPLTIAAIWERPIFGWGNLNSIDNHTISNGAEIAYSLGMLPQDYMRLWVRSDGRVSVHSLLGEGWVEGGIIGAILPLLLIGLFLSAILRANGNWAPLVILVSIQGVWDVLFSTWGYNRALTLAFSAVLAAWAVSQSRSETAQATELSDGRVSDESKARQRDPHGGGLRGFTGPRVR